jgi:glyoxylase-like metal-dependent hydrolase (beta-lactamase superfamily II)
VPHDALQIGKVEVVPLCDARVPLPLDVELPLDLPEGWQPFRDAYPWAFLGDASWDFHIHAFAVRTPEVLVLIDTGIGGEAPPDWGPVRGSIAAELVVAGIEPADVEHVVHTHLHLDHIGGATLEDGQPRFPYAKHHVHPADWAAFLDAEDPQDRAAFERCVRPLANRDMLDVTAEDHEIARGVGVIHAPGHTPGHRAVVVSSGDERLLIIGDALHHAAQVTHQGWLSTHDADPATAVMTRNALLGQARDEDLSTCVPQFAEPFGRVVNVEGLDRWQSAR